MLHLPSAITAPATIFASTNIDDLVVVSAFFAERRLHWGTIVISQLLGIGTLIVVSALMALATLALPKAGFPYLGVVPLGLGLRRLWQQLSTERRSLWASLHRESRGCSSGLLAATSATIATGGDNLVVYVPFFAKAPKQILPNAATFVLLTGVWCLLGYLLVSHNLVARHLRKLGPVVLPMVMIMIGLWLLADVWR